MKNVFLPFLVLLPLSCLSSPISSDVAARNISITEGETASYTASDYIQDGLVAMWDGIENAGLGIHDESATSWVDLTGNNFDLTANTGMDFVLWGHSFATSKKNTGLIAYGDYIFRHRNLTIEIVSDSIIQGSNLSILGINTTDAQNSGVIALRTALDTIFFSYQSYQTFVSYAFRNTHLFYSFVFDQNGTLDVYQQSSIFLQSPLSYFDVSVPEGNIVSFLGRSTTTQTFKPGLIGNFYSIRIYDRKLSQEEIAYNNSIDTIRFNLK